MAEEDLENQKDERGRPKATPVWEWIIAGVGLILVVAAIGTTLYRAMTEESTPPKLEVVIDSIAPNGDGSYLVKFAVKNTGNKTAAAVAVEGKLKDGTETGNATLTYVPSNSVRRGGLFFSKNLQPEDLQMRVTGYEEP